MELHLRVGNLARGRTHAREHVQSVNSADYRCVRSVRAHTSRFPSVDQLLLLLLALLCVAFTAFSMHSVVGWANRAVNVGQVPFSRVFREAD